MVAENLVLVAVFFLVLILLSRLFTKIMRPIWGSWGFRWCAACTGRRL